MANRIVKKHIDIPPNVTIDIGDKIVTAKGKDATLSCNIPNGVGLVKENNVLRIVIDAAVQNSHALAGTFKALTNNMLTGLHKGFERKLSLVGVGYKAQLQGKTLLLNLGFSHPIEYPIPDGITILVPVQTEIAIKGADKQLVGQVAADIRGFRPPEPYKGKGVRYVDELIICKEGKKK